MIKDIKQSIKELEEIRKRFEKLGRKFDYRVDGINEQIEILLAVAEDRLEGEIEQWKLALAEDEKGVKD